jgi:DNA-binding MarR family transcriptional regulator
MTTAGGSTQGLGTGQHEPDSGKEFRVEDMTGHLLRMAAQRHTRIWSEVVGEDLTSVQFALLESCRLAVEAGTSPDQAAVAATSGIDRSTTAEMVARLTSQGWLTSTRSDADRRRQVLRLTPPAVAALRWCAPFVDRVQKELMTPLSRQERDWLIPRWAALAGVGQDVAGARSGARDNTTRAEPGTGEVPAGAGNEAQGMARPPLRPGHLLRRAQQRHLKLWTATVSSAWTSQQFALLDAAGKAGEAGASQTELGDGAGIDRSSTSHLVSKLVAQGLLRRDADPQDARRRLVSRTRQGREAWEGLAVKATALQAELQEPLDPEDRERTRALLRRIADGA